MPQDRILANLRRKLDAWELEHLRTLASEQAVRIEHLESERETLIECAESWRKDAFDLMNELREEGKTVGMTKDGQIGVVKDTHQLHDLLALLEEWKRIAKGAFASAKTLKTDADRRFVEHRAACYENCAIDLSRALGIELGTVDYEDGPFIERRGQPVELDPVSLRI